MRDNLIFDLGISALSDITEKSDRKSGRPLPKMSEAMDGRSQAHTDVLVAVFGRGRPLLLTPEPSGYN